MNRETANASFEAYEIAACKAEHLARIGTFAASAITDWEDHRQDAALAIFRKQGESKGYLTVTGLRAMTYSHAAALREKYIQQQRPKANDPEGDPDGRESRPSEPARPGSWAHWHCARLTLDDTLPALTRQTRRTLSALLATDLDFNAAAERLHVSRATIYRLFKRSAAEFRRRCAFRY